MGARPSGETMDLVTSVAPPHPVRPEIPLPLVDLALQHARRRATSSGVEVRLVHSLAETLAAEALMSSVWGSRPGAAPVSTATMRALRHAGHYVAGAFLTATDHLVGCAVGFFSGPRALSMHSHAAAVSGAHAGRGIGIALKLHQRAWCLERDVSVLSWTFDPLIARNTHLNLTKLGAEAVEYLPDFYGPMDDARNRRVASDRLLVRWDLLRPPVPAVAPPAVAGGVLVEAREGEPHVLRPVPGRPVSVAVPSDIEAMRAEDPTRAERWQLAVRSALAPALPRGASIGFDVRRGYIVTTPSEMDPS